ncbi:hypothetical protein G4G27_16085 [Sphingomonas sp. So64.6b]|uniref:hypothetical protein n=1 Tax=Sphingomonas sp. So64.6b TaxID=2997354 RepID=UPI0015FF946A|nr:hypothetical protein [Sphingomonas sp. So64.6b]QNA85345.1 hypothetical protein G4G27_16085 [Sphingomonas sp. So64.6b]
MGETTQPDARVTAIVAEGNYLKSPQQICKPPMRSRTSRRRDRYSGIFPSESVTTTSQMICPRTQDAEIVEMKGDLLTLMVRDPGLRSILIGRLSMLGESILSLEGSFDDPAIRRHARPPAILIIDLESLDGRLDELLATQHWKGIIILAETAAPLGNDRVRMIGSSEAPSHVVETLAGWRCDPQPIRAE